MFVIRTLISYSWVGVSADKSTVIKKRLEDMLYYNAIFIYLFLFLVSYICESE